MNFEDTWRNIISHAGEEFFTKRNPALRIRSLTITLYRFERIILFKIANFQKAAEFKPLDGPGQINDLVRGSSYVFAILTEKRIQ